MAQASIQAQEELLFFPFVKRLFGGFFVHLNWGLRTQGAVKIVKPPLEANLWFVILGYLNKIKGKIRLANPQLIFTPGFLWQVDLALVMRLE